MAKSTPRSRICAHCGAQFVTCWPKQIFCQKKCKQDAHNAINQAKRTLPIPHPQLCVVCGSIYTPRQVRRDATQTCSRRCLSRRGNRKRSGLDIRDNQQRPCPWCRDEFTPVRSNQDHCSPDCWWRHRALLARENKQQRICLDCTAAIEQRGPQASYCKSCIARRKHMWAASRRALKQGAFVEEVNLRYICERDKWTCGICSKKVDKRLQWPHPRSPSLDHVIALFNGGEHSTANAQLAHLVCNQRKHTKTLTPQQLAMIG